MIQAVLLDDEKHCIESLALDINKYCPEISIVKELTSAKEGLKYLKSNAPDILFLDIEMPWMNGFELLEYLQPINFEVIFVTAYDTYALKAFKVCAIDYLMKPIDKDDLIKAVEKVKSKIGSTEQGNDKIHNLLESYFSKKSTKKIAFAEKDRQQFIDPKDILFVSADSNYSKVKLENGQSLTLSMTLKSIESKLDLEGFLRVHHSYLVNMDKVIQYVKADGGYLVLVDNSMIPISRSKRGDLKSFLEQDFK